jgi:hypothetical protein
LKPKNYASGDKSEFAEAISLNGQNILFALKENSIHRHSKPEDPSTESNPHQFGLPTDNLIDITGERKQFLTCTEETTRAELERLCSARLIQGDQKIISRHAEVLTRLNDL